MLGKYEESVDGNNILWNVTVNSEDNSHIIICRNGISKTIKIIEDCEFSYKLQKTQVRAAGGASGLFGFINRALTENFMECKAWYVLNYCFFKCRAAA